MSICKCTVRQCLKRFHFQVFILNLSILFFLLQESIETSFWKKITYILSNLLYVATPLWAKCEDETHTPKVWDLEPSGTPKCLEFNKRGQNTSHWVVLGVIRKVLKCKCPKWPHIGHLDICNSSYGQKKGQESNWQFDSRPLKVGNRPLPDIRF
jgi:hypothetical protein